MSHTAHTAGEPDWAAATDLARTLIPRLLEQPAGTALNVNVPAAPGADPVESRHASRSEVGGVHMTATDADDQSEESLRMTAADPSTREPAGTGHRLEPAHHVASRVTKRIAAGAIGAAAHMPIATRACQ